MTNEAVLEQPLKQSQKSASWLTRFQKAFAGIEIALWGVFALARILQKAHVACAEEVVIIALSIIAMLYLLVPFLVFGSRGWKRHIGSYYVGIALYAAVSSYLFVIERWPLAKEMGIVSFPLCFIGTLITFIFMCLNFRWNPGDRFYIFVLLRLLICTMIALVTTDFMP